MVARAIIALIALLAIASGCGVARGELSVEERATPDPAAAYRAALGRQCVTARFERSAVPPPAGPTARDLAAYLTANARVARRSARAAEALTPPPRLAADHLRARLLAREGTALVERAAARARRPGADPDRILDRLQPALNARIAEGNALAERIGLPQCRQAALDLAFAP